MYDLLPFPFYNKMLKIDKGVSFIIIYSNLKSYAGGPCFSENGNYNDGKLEMLDAKSKIAIAKLMLNRPPVAGSFLIPDAVTCSLPIKLSFDSPPPVQLDGENYSHFFDGGTDFEISHAGSITVYR